RRRPGGKDQLRDGQPRGEELALEGSDVLLPDHFMVDRGDRVLPQLWLWNPRAEVARDRSHVAVQELVPCLTERIVELVRMLVEALRERPIDRIHLQCKIRREHHGRLPLRPIMSGGRGGHCASGIRLRSVLLAAGRARRQLIIVLVEIIEEPVVTLCRFGGPGALQPARDRVAALAAAKTVLPAETLLLQTGTLRFGTDVPGGGGGTVRLADRVAADDERNRLLVVHRHAGERLSNVARRKGRVRLAARALR